MSYTDALTYVESLNEEKKAKLVDSLLGRLGKYDVPLRELEYSAYTFDLIMDQGAYAEFKRHRMMTQTPQKLTTRLGYATPRLITEAGFGSQYEAAMESAATIYEKLYQANPECCAVRCPNGFNRRALAQFNLREAYAFANCVPQMRIFQYDALQQSSIDEMACPSITDEIYEIAMKTWKSVEESFYEGLGVQRLQSL
jgi:hypothetical protein